MKLLDLLNIKEYQVLKTHSTFGIGGKARFFEEVTTVSQMQQAFSFCRQRKIPYFILGKGSNCLFDDLGFGGMIIKNKISAFHLEGDIISVGAGFPFSLLGVRSAKSGLSGLEFASGIPGTVGGAVYMNAGANGRETADSLQSVLYLTPEGEEVLLPRNAIDFSYRYSSFQKDKGVILGATFCLQKDQLAKKRQQEYIAYRKCTQPYGELSIGCIFRNTSKLFIRRIN